VRLDPAGPPRRSVIWVHPQGKASMYDAAGALVAPVRRLLEGGLSVVSADLLDQGELTADGQPRRRQRWLENEEGFAGWTYCYNLPLAARRVHDVLAIAAMLKAEQDLPIDLCAFGPAAAWAAGAVVQSRGKISRAALDTRGFRFAAIDDVYDAHFLPGAVKYGDLPGLLALAAPTPLWLAGETEPSASLVIAAYRAAGQSDRLTLSRSEQSPAGDTAVDWLMAGGL
jgi:hypothetical protein